MIGECYFMAVANWLEASDALVGWLSRVPREPDCRRQKMKTIFFGLAGKTVV